MLNPRLPNDRSVSLLCLLTFLSAAGVFSWEKKPTLSTLETCANIQLGDHYVASCSQKGAPLGARSLLWGQKIALNSASAQDLATLPGVSRKVALRTIAYRERVGRISDLDSLQAVKGISVKTVQRLKQYVTTKPPS